MKKEINLDGLVYVLKEEKPPEPKKRRVRWIIEDAGQKVYHTAQTHWGTDKLIDGQFQVMEVLPEDSSSVLVSRSDLWKAWGNCADNGSDHFSEFCKLLGLEDK